MTESIKHNKNGFEWFAKQYATIKANNAKHITIDMANVGWFDADLAAALGAILADKTKAKVVFDAEQITSNANATTISLNGLSKITKDALAKNKFCKLPNVSDEKGTTVIYKRFRIDQELQFQSYIGQAFTKNRQELPQMTKQLLKEFRKSIFELFSNAVTHSETKRGVFCCGQFYPKQEKLDFTIVDRGIGIRQNIKRHKQLNLGATEAINWATQELNTTRQGAVSGGLGLKLLSEFVDLNGGAIHIVSDTGYWKRSNKIIQLNTLNQPFPGTIVCLEFNTADDKSYGIYPQTKPDEIL